MSRGSMARSSMISPMTCPLFTLISWVSSRSISSTQKAETLWAKQHWVPDPKIQFEQNTMKVTVQMNLRSHTSVPDKLKFPNVEIEKQCIHITFLFSSLNLRHFQKQLTFTLYLTTAGQNKCTKVLTIKSSSTGGSDQRGREEPELVLDPMWYAIFCTCRRSGRSCMLTLQLQRQDQEEYIHLEFVLHL